MRHCRPWLCRAGRYALWSLVAGYFGFAAIAIVLRYMLLPQIADHRADIERALSAAMRLPVAVASIEADWQGFRPRLVLHGLQIHDAAGRPALSFDNVEAVLGWSSLLHLEPRMHLLHVHAPILDVRRDISGQLFVAGLAVDTGATRPGFADWLLRQSRVEVSDATVTWTDAQRAAVPLTLTRLNFALDSSGRSHRFGINAAPPPDMATQLDLRGDLRGSDLAALADWNGKLYIELGNADLAIWRTWIDYPVELPRGRGGLRLWLDFAQRQPTALTADLALEGVALRLAPALPMLELTRLDGRVQFERSDAQWTLSTRKLSLATVDGVAIAPADVTLRWQPQSGEFIANSLDLGDLARLSAYLPLVPEMRDGLTRFAPHGRLKDCTLSWRGEDGQAFRHYRIDARFEQLAVAATGRIPGASGLSGSIVGDESGGRLELAGRDAGIELPAIFPEARIALASLDLLADWTRSGEDFSVDIRRASFRNADVEGSASGRYRRERAGTPGEIDLRARLTRGEGAAVWRYLPYAVNIDTRNWLHDAVTAGRADEVTLQLKGDLARFPFADRSGVFRIQGRFHGATLKPAPGWPAIEDIAGDLLFDAARMHIGASQGRILGATVGPVSAEIADLAASEELLIVEGKAKGPTAAFLRFIESSPVGERIDHFTEDMHATGAGELDLKLTLPLRHMDTTQVAGGYRFDGNKVIVAAGIPPLDDVRGRIEFTEQALTAKDIRARALGGPLSVDVRTQNEGLVAVDMRGEIGIHSLRQQMPSPLFDYLSGSARWEGSIRVKKKIPEIRISSDLRGIASSLPEPFNKSASEARPLLFERKVPDARLLPRVSRGVVRDEIDISLARALQVQWLRVGDDSGSLRVERGLATVGAAAARLPERGALLAINLPRIDFDLLRHVTSGGSEGIAPAFSQIDLRANEASAFGRTLHDLRLSGAARGEHWNADLRSREITGRFDWIGEGKGRLSGRIAQFNLPSASSAATAVSSGDLDELPALDLTFDRFIYGERDFGELKLTAENRGTDWHATVAIQNADGSVNAEGKWRPGDDAPDTLVDFKFKANSIENMLNRIGYPNAVRRGSASLEGKLNWNGPPFSPDMQSLNGSVRFDARDGQFNKLEPGVGRLLGVISLQSLPRRITLDFRDVFSEGFAFDRIEGEAKITRGVLDTRDLEIAGPAARVAMQGTIDLTRETQNLRVRVQPAFGESVATGVLLAHPAAGAAAWVFNKLFGNPLDQIFAYEYAVTGAWIDPKVEKVGGPGKAEAQMGKSAP